jgi:hypothetical protein
MPSKGLLVSSIDPIGDRAETSDAANDDEDDFTDIELAELDAEGVTGQAFAAAPNASVSTDPILMAMPSADSVNEPASEVGTTDGRLSEAHAIAEQLAEYVADLNQLDEAELPEHVEYYQRAHSHLQRTLSDIDNA